MLTYKVAKSIDYIDHGDAIFVYSKCDAMLWEDEMLREIKNVRKHPILFIVQMEMLSYHHRLHLLHYYVIYIKVIPHSLAISWIIFEHIT